MLNIVLFGAPGCGKGTQSELLEKRFSLRHISTGNIIREQIAAKTELGLQMQACIERGELAPDQLVIDMVADYVATHTEGTGVIFDGFPRTTAQAEAFDEILAKHGQKVSVMINMEVPEEELVKRILLRGKDSESDLVGYESNAAWLKSKIDTSWFVTLNEGVLADQSISEYYGAAYIIIAGAVEGANGYEFTTPVYTFQVPLVPKPVLTITPLKNSVSYEAGTITLNYSVENAAEGDVVTLSKDASWTTTTIENGKITIAYTANDSAKARTASLSFSYPNIDASTVVTLSQEANPNAEVVTFSLEVTETHFDHVIVNVTPSNTNTKFALGGVSKKDFENAYTYNNSDSKLQEDLASPYYKPAIISGAQTGYK